jgi:hypothetical protein
LQELSKWSVILLIIVYGKVNKLNSKIGTITRTYDNPSATLPYPKGYNHDLSLITSPDLPDICTPRGIEMIPEWAKYEDALDGETVFECILDIIHRKHHRLQGTVASKELRY